MCKAQRLHSAAMLLKIGKYMRSLFPLYTVVLFKYSDNLPFTTYINTILLVGGFLSAISIVAFVNWKRFSYTIHNKEIVIEHGVFTHKKRYIPKERIQSLQESEDIIHRLFGLVKLQIDTAGGAGPEVVLEAITKEAAEYIRNELTHHIEAADTEDAAHSFPYHTFQLSSRRLVLYAATSGTVGIVLSAAMGGYLEISDYFHISFRMYDLYARQPAFYAAAIVLIALMVWIVGMIIVYQRYYKFQVVRQQEDLIITRGLFKKQKLTIPLQRIQAVRLEESIIRQVFRVATVRLVSAGGKSSHHEELSLICFPLVRIQELPLIFTQFLPDFEMHSSLHRLPRRACKRYIFRAVFPVIILSVIACYYAPAVRYVSPCLIVAAGWLGYKRFTDAGWKIVEQQLTFVSRRIARTTVFVTRSRIQSLSVHKAVFQESSSLCTIKGYVKSGFTNTAFGLKDADELVGTSIRRWYSYERKVIVPEYMKRYEM